MNANSRTALTVAFVLAEILAKPFSSPALTISQPGLTCLPSGSNLVFSFPTTSTNYYGLQTCVDLSEAWIDIKAGVTGNGSIATITLNRPTAIGYGFYRVVVQPKPAGLILPQGDAFAILGHSCGGIQEQVTATGFDPISGYPTGNVSLKTSCGGSGRGGGYHTTTYTASAAVVWDFNGNVVSYATPAGSLPPVPFASDTYGDILYNSGASAFLIVPVPSAPMDVTAVQSGDEFQVNWLPVGVNPISITSTTLTATPVNSSADVLVTNISGSGTNGVIVSVQPQTIYRITVANSTASGTGPASASIILETSAASVPPLAPTGVTAQWSNPDPGGATDTLIASWSASVPGDSPVDQYQVVITGGGSFTNIVAGTTLTTSFDVNYIPNWKVIVKAHNAVGWGPASTTVNLGGL